MIKINGVEIQRNHFPDGSIMCLDFPSKVVDDAHYKDNTTITWLYESDEEIVFLYEIVRHIREHNFTNRNLTLIMPYVPSARMDRVKRDSEIFTLKYTTELINLMNFDVVKVADPHSIASEIGINKIVKMNISEVISEVIGDIEGKFIDDGKSYEGKTVIYFPDDGAMKRYKDLPCFEGRTLVYGKKNRDWDTGKILGIDVYNQRGEIAGVEDLKDKVVLMVDDIVSYGGTLAYSADRLRELKASAVYAYATHTENNILNEEKGTLLKRLNNGTVDVLYTTNSIYNGEHPSICIIHEF